MINELDNYIITELISNCNDGAIYKAVDPAYPFTLFAIRVIPKELISPSKFLALEKETLILQTVAHENIIKLKGTRVTKKHYCLIFEYCSDGNLASFIKTQQCITENLLRHIIKQIVKALDALHSMNIVHNNLSLSNILLIKKGDELNIKLADFRSAQFVNPKTKDSRHDILDMGCILQRLIYGESLNNITNLSKKLNLSKDCFDFLTHCFQITTKKKFSFKKVKVHPFIGMDDEVSNNNEDWLLIGLEETREEEDEFEVVNTKEVGVMSESYE